MNPTPHIVESALLLLAAFVIGCLIGFALKRFLGQRGSQPIKEPVTAEAPKASADSGLGLLDAPEGAPDDLRQIKGIGPKLETLLNENGVYHYRQIAAWDAEAIAIMNERLSVRGRIEREKWVSQANALLKRD